MDGIVKQHRRAIFTVPGEMGQERCWGKEVHEIADRRLASCALNTAREFLKARRLNGQEFVEQEGIHVYGPFPSPEMVEAMASAEAMAATPTERNQMTLERAESPSAFSHYLLNASFLVARKGAPKE